MTPDFLAPVFERHHEFAAGRMEFLAPVDPYQHQQFAPFPADSRERTLCACLVDDDLAMTARRGRVVSANRRRHLRLERKAGKSVIEHHDLKVFQRDLGAIPVGSHRRQRIVARRRQVRPMLPVLGVHRPFFPQRVPTQVRAAALFVVQVTFEDRLRLWRPSVRTNPAAVHFLQIAPIDRRPATADRVNPLPHFIVAFRDRHSQPAYHHVV